MNLDDETKRELAKEMDTINDQLLEAVADEPIDLERTVKLLAYAQAAQLRVLAMCLEPPPTPNDPRQLTLPWGKAL